MRIAKRDLADVAAGRKAILTVRTFGREAGLDEVACTGGVFFPLGEPPRDRLWFPTGRGLFTVDTRNLPLARPAPGVRLVSLELGENVSVDGADWSGPHAASLAEPGSSRDVSIGYTALDFTTSERARFRYVLTGAVEQRSALTEERHVRFSRLPPGSYEFRVTACNGDGVWHEAGASAAWTVHPFFWETPWFRLGSLLFMCCLVAVAARTIERRRVHSRLKEAEREEELSRERTRIARDLHDEIGAKLTRLSLLGTMVAEDAGDVEQLRRDAGEIAGTARETHRSFDEIVWSVSPRNDAVRSLSHYICKYAEEFFAGSGVLCLCQLPENLPDHPLDPKKRHQVFLAVKEALNNVMKHSKATQVSIEFSFSPGGPLCIEVGDNGCGFDSRSCEGRGEGLRNIRERIGMAGGRLKLESSEGAGTRVIFEVPV
jgi:signal transduction histidine kinase